MSASTGWCCKTGRKASRTTIFFSNCQWGAIARKSVVLRHALGSAGFCSSSRRRLLPGSPPAKTFSNIDLLIKRN